MHLMITRLLKFLSHCFCLLVSSHTLATVPLSLDKNNTYRLDGNWEACGRQLQNAGYENAQRFSLSELRPHQHYCLSLTFEISETPLRNQVIFFSALAAGELFLDGVRIGINGVPAMQVTDEVPGQTEFWVSLSPDQLRRGSHRLHLKLSSYHSTASLYQQFYALSIQDQQTFRESTTLKNIAPVFLSGALILVALIFLGLTFFYQRKIHWVVFFILCMTASLLLLVEVWRSLVGYIYPFHIIRLYLVTGLTWLFSVLLPLYFLTYYRFPYIPFISIGLMAVMMSVGWMTPYFDSKNAIMFYSSLISSLVVNMIAFRRGQIGSKSGLIVAVCALGIFLTPIFEFAESGFAIVVCIMLFFILYQLVTQFAIDKEKAALATQLENQLLRKSLQPHFLMNSLSLIGELVHQSPARAEEFIQALGSEFRMLNEYAHLPVISLSQELELCHNYLAIMSTRLQQSCVLRIGGDPSGIVIPPAIFLTCLENAFSHNKYRQDTGFELKIEKTHSYIRMELSIPVGSQREHVGTGTGSNYIRQSLEEVFDGRAGYHTSLKNHFWRVNVDIPEQQ